MRNRTLSAIVNVIIRPNTCFASVSENTNYYFTSSVIIFVIAGVSVLLSSILDMSYWNNDAGHSYLDFSVMSLLLSVVHSLFQNFVLIAAIFFIGKKLGGNDNFKKTFSVLSYCLIPAIIGAFVVPVALQITSHVLFSVISGGGYLGGGSLDHDPDLSPSYALDFASSAIVSNGFTIAFGVWMLALFLKATKIVHEFNVKKSIITVVIGIVIMFLSQNVFGIIPLLLFHL